MISFSISPSWYASCKIPPLVSTIASASKEIINLIVVDPIEDKTAVLEARKLHIPVFGLCDTNCNPELVDYPIPANDDAIKSIKLIISLLADAIVETKGGILQDAYQEGEIENDITMEDVIIDVEKYAEEQEKRNWYSWLRSD